MNKFRTLSLLFLISPCIFAESWPDFNLLTATKDQLPDTTQIIIEKDPVYKVQKHYRAYALSEIIKKLTKDSTTSLTNTVLVFTAADGYKVTMSYQDALLEKGYIAYKDLSAKNGSWVKFKFGKENISPAPYYLVWPKSNLDKWRYPSPFQLTSISLQSAESYFASAAPVSNNQQVTQGFALFSRYCIRCHSVNHTGGKLGPELNLPRNITDYFTPQKLTDFILDASLYRANTKMPVFKSILNKKEVLKIQHYLESMKSVRPE